MARTRSSSVSTQHRDPKSSNRQCEYSGGTFYPGEYGEGPSDNHTSREDCRKSTMKEAEPLYKLYGNLYRKALEEKERAAEEPREDLRQTTRPKKRRLKTPKKEKRPKRNGKKQKIARFRRLLRRLFGAATREVKGEEKREVDEERRTRRRTEEWTASVEPGSGDDGLVPWQGLDS